MAKPSSQLAREIAEALGLPDAITKKWTAKVAAYKRAAAAVEAGYTDAGFWKMVKSRDALDTLIYEATAHVPYVVGGQRHLSPPILELERERKDLLASTWDRAQERGREANYQRLRGEIKRITEQEREAQKPHEWMRRGR